MVPTANVLGTANKAFSVGLWSVYCVGVVGVVLRLAKVFPMPYRQSILSSQRDGPFRQFVSDAVHCGGDRATACRLTFNFSKVPLRSEHSTEVAISQKRGRARSGCLVEFGGCENYFSRRVSGDQQFGQQPGAVLDAMPNGTCQVGKGTPKRLDAFGFSASHGNFNFCCICILGLLFIFQFHYESGYVLSRLRHPRWF